MLTLNNEKRLIDYARSGDIKSFEALYRLHVDRVYGLSKKLLSNQVDAEDACQEVFIKAWKKLTAFDEQSSFATWLYRITSNECIDRLRKRTLWHEESVGASDDNVYENKTINEDHEGEIGLNRALQQLGDKARAVVVLHEFLGYSHEEISACTSIAASTSRAHLHSAKKKLRALL